MAEIESYGPQVPGMQSGTGLPDASLGNDGDRYVDYATGDFYVKANGGWVKQATFGANAVFKDIKSRLSSGTTGAWSKTYPAGFWAGEPSINVNPMAASAGAGQITWRTTKTLVSGAWTVAVQFTMLPVSVSIAVLGTVNLGANPGTVTFDYSAAEPNAV